VESWLLRAFSPSPVPTTIRLLLVSADASRSKTCPPPHPQFPFPQYQVQHNQNFESRPRPNQQAARLRGAPQRPRQPGLKLKEGENAELRKPIDMRGWKLRSRQT
jgi:hypothetical protein